MAEAKIPRLTRAMLEAMSAALESALAGDGFDGGDFDSMNEIDFEHASEWVAAQIRKREVKKDRSDGH